MHELTLEFPQNANKEEELEATIVILAEDVRSTCPAWTLVERIDSGSLGSMERWRGTIYPWSVRQRGIEWRDDGHTWYFPKEVEAYGAIHRLETIHPSVGKERDVLVHIS